MSHITFVRDLCFFFLLLFCIPILFFRVFEKTFDTHFASVLDLESTKFEQLSNDSRDITSRTNKQLICKIVALKLKLGQSFFSIVYRCRELRKTMTLAVIIF